MTNEFLFILQITTICLASLFFCKIGKDALIAFISLLFVLANIFVVKQIHLFGFAVTSADAFIVGISLSLNLLQEFWSKQEAKKAVWISFACSFFHLIITQCILAYHPSSFDTAHQHLSQAMAYTTRIILSSFIAYLITQSIDIQLYGYIKKLMGGKFFVLRNYFSLFTSQLIDTILFSILGLWGIVENIGHIIILSYIIKIIAIISTSPFLMLTKKIIKR